MDGVEPSLHVHRPRAAGGDARSGAPHRDRRRGHVGRRPAPARPRRHGQRLRRRRQPDADRVARQRRPRRRRPRRRARRRRRHGRHLLGDPRGQRRARGGPSRRAAGAAPLAGARVAHGRRAAGGRRRCERQDDDDLDARRRARRGRSRHRRSPPAGRSRSSAPTPRSAPAPAFVVEADESDGSFLVYRPHVAVVTNVQPDHLDFYGSVEAVERAYAEFATSVTDGGLLVACSDDPGARALLDAARAAGRRVVTYGYDDGRRPPGLRDDVAGARHDVDDRPRGDRAHAAPGRAGHPQRPRRVRRLPRGGRGPRGRPGRRAGGPGGLPRRPPTLRGARRGRRSDRRRRLRPQPRQGRRGRRHGIRDRRAAPATDGCTSSSSRTCTRRTRDFAREFAHALAPADTVVLLDVYGAREQPVAGVTSALVGDPLAALPGQRDVVVGASPVDAVAAVVAAARPGDLVLTVGAGDVTGSPRWCSTPSPRAPGEGSHEPGNRPPRPRRARRGGRGQPLPRAGPVAPRAGRGGGGWRGSRPPRLVALVVWVVGWSSAARRRRRRGLRCHRRRGGGRGRARRGAPRAPRSPGSTRMPSPTGCASGSPSRRCRCAGPGRARCAVDVVPRTAALVVKNPQGRLEVVDPEGVAFAVVRTAPKGVPVVTATGPRA